MDKKIMIPYKRILPYSKFNQQNIIIIIYEKTLGRMASNPLIVEANQTRILCTPNKYMQSSSILVVYKYLP